MWVRVALLICIHKHSFGGFGADTLTFCESTPLVSIYRIFWDGGWEEVAVGFFQG
jgi:hypothetical protein